MSLTARLAALATPNDRRELGAIETHSQIAAAMLNELREFADLLGTFYLLKGLSRRERRRYPAVRPESFITECDIARIVEDARTTLNSLDDVNRDLASREIAALVAEQRTAGAGAAANVIESIITSAARLWEQRGS
jgi:hypothetical protein